jgi:hypothetical protein
MIKVIATIDDINYEIPAEVSITQYAEVMRRFSMSENEYEKALDIIAVLMEIPYQIIRDIEPEKMIELSTYLQNLIQDSEIEYQKTFKYKGVEYGGVDLSKMTFGEYIDLVSLMKNDKYIYINIQKISAILYRPIVEKKKNKYTIAPYDILQHEELTETFKELPVKYFFGAFLNLFHYLTQLKKDYEVLFGEARIDTTEKTEEDEKKKEEEESNLPWYKMIMALAGEDFTKINYVTSRPLVEAFNHLTYITIRNEDIRYKQLEYENKQKVL